MDFSKMSHSELVEQKQNSLLLIEEQKQKFFAKLQVLQMQESSIINWGVELDELLDHLSQWKKLNENFVQIRQVEVQTPEYKEAADVRKKKRLKRTKDRLKKINK